MTSSQFEPIPEKYNEFTKLVKLAAKRHIPRGYRTKYVPTWDTECAELYEGINHNSEVADLLCKKLNEKRHERWHEKTRNLDFTHPSRQAWRLLKKLGSDSRPTNIAPKVSPNAIASRLLSLSRARMERKRSKSIKNKVRKLRRCLKPNQQFSSEFT